MCVCGGGGGGGGVATCMTLQAHSSSPGVPMVSRESGRVLHENEINAQE